MFFTLSKVVWALVQPTNLIAGLLGLGVILLVLRWRKSGSILLALGSAMYIAITVFSAGQFLISPLENRFPAVPELSSPPDGILLLGGPIDSQLSEARGQISLYDGAERYTEFVKLMQRYPGAKGVVSGGNSSVTRAGQGQASYAKELLDQLGFDVSRIAFETNSRNTYENIRNSHELAKPAAGSRWVVITAAYHMPRAIAVMRKQDWPATPYPVDYRTEGSSGRLLFTTTGGEALQLTDLAVKEWVGLLAYYLTGKSAKLFPGR